MKSSHPLKILLVDDHQVTRLGVRFMLESLQVTVIGEAGNGAEAIELFASCKPDVVLMDVDMPEMDGIEAAASIKSKSAKAKIIMMTSSKDESHIFAALAAGASGYCTKDVSAERLLSAIECVARGDMWIDSAVASAIMKVMPDGVRPDNPQHDEPLTEREVDVVKLVGEGLTNAEIGKRLFISPDTVKTHIKHILEKLAVSDRTQAAVKAMKQGLI